MRGDFGCYKIEIVGDGTAIWTKFSCLLLAPPHYRFGKLDEGKECTLRNLQKQFVVVAKDSAVVAEHGGARVVQIPNLAK